ncbi:MAG: hypothetical protein ACLFVJ_17340 [Persicimonas sp.]
MSDMSDKSEENPFDKLGLDPTSSREELTERLRRLAERLPPEERKDLRAMWRELTIKDADRVKWAFLAHPRGKDTGAKPTEELRKDVPPLVDRRDPPDIEASVSDALLEFGCPDEVPGVLRPGGGFLEMAAEGRKSTE